MFLWCFWWRDDCNLGVAVAFGDFGGPVTTKKDSVVDNEVILVDECVDGMERISRVLNLRFGYAIATPDLSAVLLAVKSIAIKKRIMAWVMRPLCRLFKA